MKTGFFSRTYQLLRDTVKELTANAPLRMAGATAFFTSFALPPILMIIVRTLGLIFSKRTVGRNLLRNISEIVGDESARQILATIRGIRSLEHNLFVASLIFIFLVFVATTLFKVIKSSINQIWNIQATRKRKIKEVLLTRLQSVVVILGTGILFMAHLGLEWTQTFLSQYITYLSPELSKYLGGVVSQLISVVIVTLWFTILFLYLPDGRPRWPVALTGALFTSVLFTAGKLALGFLLRNSNLGSLYATSSSLVLLLLFVFYSSLILYFGAAFTKVWAIYKGTPIKPLKHAVRYKLTKVHLEQGQDPE